MRHEKKSSKDNISMKIFEKELLGEEPITLDFVRLKADLLANVALSDQQGRHKLRYIINDDAISIIYELVCFIF